MCFKPPKIQNRMAPKGRTHCCTRQNTRGLNPNNCCSWPKWRKSFSARTTPSTSSSWRSTGAWPRKTSGGSSVRSRAPTDTQWPCCCLTNFNCIIRAKSRSSARSWPTLTTWKSKSSALASTKPRFCASWKPSWLTSTWLPHAACCLCWRPRRRNCAFTNYWRTSTVRWLRWTSVWPSMSTSAKNST